MAARHSGVVLLGTWLDFVFWNLKDMPESYVLIFFHYEYLRCMAVEHSEFHHLSLEQNGVQDYDAALLVPLSPTLLTN